MSSWLAGIFKQVLREVFREIFEIEIQFALTLYNPHRTGGEAWAVTLTKKEYHRPCVGDQHLLPLCLNNGEPIIVEIRRLLWHENHWIAEAYLVNCTPTYDDFRKIVSRAPKNPNLQINAFQIETR